MKFRSGFVSNSSSCSFCLYGWKVKTHQDGNLLKTQLLAAAPKLDITTTYDIDNTFIVGVGTYEDNIDHYMDIWEDYESEGPTAAQTVELDLIAKTLGLETPTIFSGNFRDG